MAGPAAGTGHSTQSMAGQGRRLPSPLLRRPVEGRPKCCHSILCTSLYKEESESESHSVVSNSLQLYRLYSPWNSLGQGTGVSSLSLLQEIFLTQGLNLGLLYCRQILYQLSHKGSPSMGNGNCKKNFWMR